MKLVLDTNVLIASALKGGLSEHILRLASRGELSLITSEEILKELSEKLLSKFTWKDSEVILYAKTLREISEVVRPSKKLSVISKDPDDNKILEVALEAGVDLIISMDHDLLQLKNFEGAGIIHPKTLTWIIPKLFKVKEK